MNIFRAWKRVFGATKESTMQTEEDRRRRELEQSLIDEYRSANAKAREELRETVPAVNARYVATMDRAMEIIRGQ
jgi:hypothetical protein